MTLGATTRNVVAKSSRPSAIALKYCQATVSAMTFVLPLPVAILTAYRVNSSYCSK